MKFVSFRLRSGCAKTLTLPVEMLQMGDFGADNVSRIVIKVLVVKNVQSRIDHSPLFADLIRLFAVLKTSRIDLISLFANLAGLFATLKASRIDLNPLYANLIASRIDLAALQAV